MRTLDAMVLALAATVAGETTGSPAQERREPPTQPLDTIVMISGVFSDGPTLGAGIVFGGDPGRLLIVTAAHVVARRSGETAAGLTAQFRSRRDARLAAGFTGHADLDADVAVLEVPDLERQGMSFCDQPFGWFAFPRSFPVRRAEDARRRNAIQRGSAVYPVGHPNGVGWILPAVPDRIVEAADDSILFQSTFIGAGHSGGALILESGEVVGLIQAHEPPLGRARHIASVFDAVRSWGYPVAGHWPGAAHRAVMDSNIDELRRLLVTGGCAVVGEQDDRGRSPLQLAADRGERAAVALLLDHGADVGRTNGGEPALSLAAGAGRGDIIALLLKAGADISQQDGVGNTPLFYAIRARSPETIQALLAAGAAIDHLNADGETALFYAVGRRDVASVRLLLDAGAKVNLQNRWGVTPLSLVAERRHEDEKQIHRLLVASGARR